MSHFTNKSMDLINIEQKNNIKIINKRAIEEILKDFEPKEFEYKKIIHLFKVVNSENDLIRELRKIKKETTPISILLIIKAIGNLSISEANPILEKVLDD